MNPARPRLLLERVVVRDLRNLERVTFEPAPRLNVVSGDNGHGKTTLLEAIYFAATSRSFRTPKLGELVRRGATTAMVRATFAESAEASSLSREQTAVVEGSRATVRIDGNRPETLAAFATRSPIVAFHPEELALSTGPAAGRRRLLDRLALFIEPSSADHRARYAHAIRARQRLLHDRSLAGVDAFEELAALHGAALTRARNRAALTLETELCAAFVEIGAPGLELRTRFVPGGSEDADVARRELGERRERDAHRPSASFGPHKDELVLELGGYAARGSASQGQHRALTLALKAAETACIAAVRGVEPILLLDDVSSELDGKRTEALFAFLARSRGQIFLTTTRRELIVTPQIPSGDRRDFRLVGGALEP